MTDEPKKSLFRSMTSAVKSGINRTMHHETVQRIMDQLLSHGVNGMGPFIGAQELADEYRRNGRYRSVDEMADSMIRWESSKNFGSGFITGAGGAVVLPVAIPAGIYSSWVIQVRLAAAVALLYGHSLSDDKTRTFILLALMGDRAKDTLKSTGLTAAKIWGEQAVKRIPAETLGRINQAAGFRLLAHAGEGGVVSVSKIVPVAGGVLSGLFDAVGCYITGKAAKRIFGGGKVPDNEEYTVVLYEEHLSRIITSASKYVRSITLPEDNRIVVRFSGILHGLSLRFLSFADDVLQFEIEGWPVTRWIAGKVLDHAAKRLPGQTGSCVSRKRNVISIQINNLVREYTGNLKGITLSALDICKGKISLTLR
ncbi:MAG TPA: EcsC family protein [Spirochaetota bacterium]|nr:EcsC family protein [Spirochaetota bacterium]HQO03885.1 EcsC family protein [Spirochaetota bacterium]